MAIPLPSGDFGRTRGRAASRTPRADLTESLRRRLASDLHVGRLAPGDRLPSIRAVARETGVDHRAVADAYRVLAEEGLVEIQGRSGVRVRGDGRPEGGRAVDSPAERVSWLAGVIAEGWTRRLTTGDLRRMIDSCVGGGALRCACVESDRDQMVAYCAEIGQFSEMAMVPCYVASGGAPGEREGLRETLRGCDVVVTTQYHSATVREALGEDGPPVVLLRVHPELAEAVRSRIRQRRLTVVAATPGFGERLRLMYAESLREGGRLRVVLADDEAGLRALDPEEPILLTRAARELLPELWAPNLAFPHSPTIARDSLHELTRILVRRSMADSPPSGEGIGYQLSVSGTSNGDFRLRT